MTEWIEEWICIKVCMKLEHYSVETIQIIQKAFRDDAMSAVQIKVRHKRFKDGWESVDVSHLLEGLQQADHLRMLSVYKLQSAKTWDWRCKNWKLIWGFSKLLCPRFWHWILEWNVLWQNLIHGFCYQDRRNTAVLQVLGELCEVPRCLLWRELRHHCPVYSVSYSLYVLQ